MARVTGKRYAEYLVYLFFWGILLLSPVWAYVLDPNGSELSWSTVLTFWEYLIPAAILFFVNNYVLIPFFLYKKRGGYYIVYTLCLVVVLCLLYVFSYDDAPKGLPPPRHDRGMHHHMDERPVEDGPGFDEMAPDRRGMKPRPPKVRPEDKVFFRFSHPGSVRVLLVILVLVFNVCIRMTFFAMRRDERYEELEKEMLKTELDYLKYQINPHFFMNTLNNIHALVDIDKERAQKAVLELSKMMRYVLYDSTAPLVPLNKEIAFLRSYIDLMRLRYTDKLRLNVVLDIVGAEGVMVPSLLFVVFLENAFKHGVSYNKDSDIAISIMIDETDGKVVLSCSNSLCKRAEDTVNERKGIGIENARKRLSLLYGENASLVTAEEGDRYNVVLKIPIQYDKVLDN
ncbi:MAG: histidine kinase [Bacteroidaceae bacterium]|nr:histidine kinase [Bacteroidaceae bacterium]